MATNYYVDFVNGLDANNGLGPDASAVTNKPWKTITKLLGAAGLASGDTAYLSPAGPFRETVAVAMTSATAETKIIGDYENKQGFKTSAGVAVAPGPVILTAYTTNDKTAPAAAITLNFAGRDFLTFQNMMIVGGSTTVVSAGAAHATDIKFTDCAIFPGALQNAGSAVSITGGTFGLAINWTFDRCLIFKLSSSGAGVTIVLATGTGADYDANILFRNTLFLGGASVTIAITASGTAANRGGGVRLKNCTDISTGQTMTTAATYISTTIPCDVVNCLLIKTSAQAVLSAGTSGQITENYNLIYSGTARTNVTAGANSISDGSYAPLFHFGQERIWGMFPRPYGAPMSGSPILGFGGDGTQTAYDLFNRPRPAGGASALPAAGALERGNTFGKETTTVQSGTNAISIVGPGYQDFYVPVDATATVLSIYLRYDSTYAGTRPQIQLLANGEIGVVAQTVTATTAALNAWEQNSLASFTPTAKGIVVFRVISNDTNGAGKAFADTFAIT